MRAAGYSTFGGPEVLEVRDRPVPEPGPGQVRVRVALSGVNPTDWKSRRGALKVPIPPGEFQVTHHDGAGVVEAVGPDVPDLQVGQRVWTWLAAYQRWEGTAQELAVVPADRVSPLPDPVPFEVGASLGVPFMTAHRALTVHADASSRLALGALAGMTVLVAGGAGAVGNAAIQLARWAGARVITTVSSPEKAELAAAAGAEHVVNYRDQDVVEVVRSISPDGVDIVVEVSPGQNAETDTSVLGTHGVVAVYANNGGLEMSIPISPHLWLNGSWHFVLLYTMRDRELRDAAAAIGAALDDGAIRVGRPGGLPLHYFALDDVAEAHRAVEDGAVGKVLVRVDEP